MRNPGRSDDAVRRVLLEAPNYGVRLAVATWAGLRPSRVGDVGSQVKPAGR